MRSVVTEKDLNRDFFTSAADDKDSSRRKRPFKSIVSNCRFCFVFLAPKLWAAVLQKMRNFSLTIFLRRTFPGVVLLSTWFQVLLGLFSRPCQPTPRVMTEGEDLTTTLPLAESTEHDDPEGTQTEHEDEHARLRNLAGNPVPMEEPYPSKALVKESWLGDIFTGLSVGAMSVPMGMSYALLAGLGYEFGLYNNFIYPFAYMIFGSCRHAVLGVSAMENIMLGVSIDQILPADATPDQRHNAALGMCIMAAVIYMLFRICKLAVLADLLAESVLSGFATASAFLIGTSQLRHVFDLQEIRNDWGFLQSWGHILTHIYAYNWYSVLIAVVSLVFLFTCKRLSKKCGRFSIPGPLLLVMITCIISWAADLERTLDTKIVGYIPQGLPNFSWPQLSWSSASATNDAPYVWDVFMSSLLLCPIYFVIHMSIAKTIAVRNNYGLDVPQELVAFSLSNLMGGVLHGFPGATSLSRSSVTETLGAQTQLHGVAAGLIVICTVLFLTIPLGYLPMPALAAVVLFGVIKMAEFGKLARLWRLQKVAWLESSKATKSGGVTIPDLLLWLASFLGTLLISPQLGILLSVGLSLIWVGKGIVRPPFIQLARIEGTEIYRNIYRFPGAKTDEGVVLYRIDASINFCNANFLELQTKSAIVHHFGFKALSESRSRGLSTTELRSVVSSEDDLENLPPSQNQHERWSPCRSPCKKNASPGKARLPSGFGPAPDGLIEPPYFFVLDCSSVNGLDVTAISALRRIAEFATLYRCVLLFANWKGPQRDYLQHADFYTIVPPHHCFLSNHDAVSWAKAARTRCLRTSPSPRSLAMTTTAPGEAEMAATWRARTAVGDDRLLSDHQVHLEWDGLSALVPHMRLVREVAADGSREWPIAVAETVLAPMTEEIVPKSPSSRRDQSDSDRL